MAGATVKAIGAAVMVDAGAGDAGVLVCGTTDGLVGKAVASWADGEIVGWSTDAVTGATVETVGAFVIGGSDVVTHSGGGKSLRSQIPAIDQATSLVK